MLEDGQVYSVNEFCRAHRISRGHFYNLVKIGDGPDLIKIGKRTLVSKEAAARWRQKFESVA